MEVDNMIATAEFLVLGEEKYMERNFYWIGRIVYWYARAEQNIFRARATGNWSLEMAPLTKMEQEKFDSGRNDLEHMEKNWGSIKRFVKTFQRCLETIPTGWDGVEDALAFLCEQEENIAEVEKLCNESNLRYLRGKVAHGKFRVEGIGFQIDEDGKLNFRLPHPKERFDTPFTLDSYKELSREIDTLYKLSVRVYKTAQNISKVLITQPAS